MSSLTSPLLEAGQREAEFHRLTPEQALQLAKELETNTTLTSLDLGGCKLGDASGKVIGKALEQNSTLTKLDLYDCQLGDASGKVIGKALEKNSTLTWLKLRNCQLGDASGKVIGEALEKNSTLTYLNLGDNQLGGESGKAIGKALEQNSTLTSLELYGCQLGDASGNVIGKALEQNSTLTSLCLQCCTLGDASGNVIGKALEKNSTLTSLDLSGNKLGDESGKAIGKALKKNSTLTSLCLQYCQLGDTPGKVIGEALEQNSTLTKLDLWSNKLGDESRKAIGKALEKNSTLTSLDLGANKLGDESGQAIGAALKKNSTLTSLNLNLNKLGDESGKAIGKALEQNSTLTSLDLGDCQLGDASGKVIGEALEKNSTLTYLNLRYCQLGDASGKVIGEALEKNSTLTYLNLGGNKLGDESGEAIGAALKRNRQNKAAEELEIATLSSTLAEMAGALEQGVPFPHVRLQVFGRGGVGKSSTINAMCGKPLKTDWVSTVGAELPVLQLHRQTVAVGDDAIVLRKYDPEPGTKEESLALAAHAAVIFRGTPQVTEHSMLARAAAQEEETAEESAQVMRGPLLGHCRCLSGPCLDRWSLCLHNLLCQHCLCRLPCIPHLPSASRTSQSSPASPPRGAPTSAPAAVATPTPAPARVVAPAAEAPPAQARARVDPTMVIEYHKGTRKQELVLHVQDSGGQPRFYSLLDLLHAPQACIGAVCFSLPELCDAATRVDCIGQLRLQLDAFASRSSATPLLLVGTRKGEVARGLAHLQVLSALLDRELSGCPAYDNLVRNDKEELAFFGVENKDGLEHDGTIRALIAAIEKTARDLPSMKLRVPPGWIAVYDYVSELSRAQPPRPHMSRMELLEVAGRCGLPHMPAKVSLEREVDVMLGFLHALGAVLWFDLPKLRELVVCDPQWLIDGVSRVIRDFEKHRLDVDRKAERKKKEWRKLTDNGMLHGELLGILWSEPKYQGQQPALLELMEHFSFLVRIPDASDARGNKMQYIVPALLTKPIARPSSLISGECSLVLHFELDRCPAKHNLVVEEANLEEGFLPQGLIHHLLGSAVGWTYHTTDGFEPSLGCGSAHVSFGAQQLVLEHVQTRPFLIRCTIIGINKGSVGGAHPVCNRLRLLTDRVMQRYPALRYRMLLQLPSAPDTFIDQQQLAAPGDKAVFVRGEHWDMHKLKKELCAWLRPPTPPSEYDLFFSYSHQSAFDSQFIQRVHDATVAHGHVAFLDQFSLKPGEDLAFACMLAIANSRLLVPLISWSSLRRLSVLTADSECSYYLLELTLIVLLQELNERPILPIFVGASDADGSPDASVDLFTCQPPKASGDGCSNELNAATNKPLVDKRNVFDRMPKVVVLSVKEQIIRFFTRQEKQVPAELSELTVDAVVKKLKGLNGVVTWSSSSPLSKSGEDYWGLEMCVAEKLHKQVVAIPKGLPECGFAKPAYPGEQDEVLKKLRELQEMVNKVDSNVRGIRQLTEAHFKMLSTLLKGAEQLAPKLICFIPIEQQDDQWNWRLRKLVPKNWFTQRVRIFFVDPITLTLAKTNNNEGFELEYPKDWVAKALPYVKLGLTVLKVAAVAGKLSGIPSLDVGKWLDSQLEEVRKLEKDGLKKIGELMGDQQKAAELMAKVEDKCSEMLEGQLQDVLTGVQGSALSVTLQQPLMKSLEELDALLEKDYPNWKAKCGLELAVDRDGNWEWVLPEHVDEFSKGGAGALRLCLST